jgi:hypothetical protein
MLHHEKALNISKDTCIKLGLNPSNGFAISLSRAIMNTQQTALRQVCRGK